MFIIGWIIIPYLIIYIAAMPEIHQLITVRHLSYFIYLSAQKQAKFESIPQNRLNRCELMS